MNWLEKIFGGRHDSTLKKYRAVVEKINTLEDSYKSLDDVSLKNVTTTLRERLAQGEELDALLPEAFALVREASRRTLGERHYDVQLIGGQILHHGAIAEMRTGEGKTLVATLPAYLNALSGNGVHIVTVNDYLSRRDAAWMGQVYNALGLSVGVLNHETSYLYDATHTEKDKERDETGSFHVVHEFLKPCSRKEAYAADITYGTNNEFGFDYLRDNIVYSKDQLVQRGFNYAIVDEVDSILIDEARTPLIISAPAQDSENLYKTCAEAATHFIKNTDYTVDEKLRAIQLTDAGIDKAEKLLGIENMYTEKGIKFVHHMETAVRALALFHKDKEYVVRNNEIVIVDEFTGRLQPGRRWSEGLHQAIEAKEGVAIQKESKTLASITYQNYFRFYSKLSGMTGTAETSAEEFEKVYGTPVIPVPTHRTVARTDLPDLVYQTEHAKFKAITAKVQELYQKGQPVLVGTASIDKNELLSEYLKRAGVPFEMLNAKNHEREGEIIAQAGKKNSVFIATNMAGRGVDIKLGGVPKDSKKEQEVRDMGGLYVIGTERHEARRIDNQLRGRSGRQGDPGVTQFYVSLEDSLMRIFSGDAMKSVMGRMGMQEDDAIESRLVSKSIESAQKKVENHHFEGRRTVLQYDDVLNQQRKSIYERRRKILLGGNEEIDIFLAALIEKYPDTANVLETAKKNAGEEAFYNALRGVILQTIDTLWMDHLEIMEYTRSSVNLRAYGQRDPLVEYKKEGLRLFRMMDESLYSRINAFVPQLQTLAEQMRSGALTVQNEAPFDASKITEGREGEYREALAHSVSQGETIGRNDPCPCGSGKKWKKCGDLNTEEHQKLMASKS